MSKKVKWKTLENLQQHDNKMRFSKSSFSSPCLYPHVLKIYQITLWLPNFLICFGFINIYLKKSEVEITDIRYKISDRCMNIYITISS